MKIQNTSTRNIFGDSKIKPGDTGTIEAKAGKKLIKANLATEVRTRKKRESRPKQLDDKGTE